MRRNLSGTSRSSFTLGITGATIHHGDDDPENTLGQDSDLYIRTSEPMNLYVKDEGDWEVLFEEDPTVVQDVYRGDTLFVDIDATVVRVLRSPYTVDNGDITIDSGLVTVDSAPRSNLTTIALGVSAEGRQIIVQDVSSHPSEFNIYIPTPVDGVDQTLTADREVIEVIYVNSAWHVIGR